MSNGLQGLAIVILTIHLVFLFIFLGTAASDYFCPNLSTLSNTFHLPPDITGVTLLALGNSAPDLLASIVAMHSSGSISLAMGELLGAGLFVGGVVVGAVALFARFPTDPTVERGVTLERSVFLRDLGFFILTIMIMGAVLADGKLHWWESLICLGVYCGYIAFIIIRYSAKRRKERTRNAIAGLTRKSSVFNQEEEVNLLLPRSRSSSNMSIPNQAIVPRLNPSSTRHSITSAVEFWDASYNAGDECNIISAPKLRVKKNFLCPICSRLPVSDDEKKMIVIMKHFCPIFWSWEILGFFGRLVSILNFPATILLSLTVPVVGCPEDDELLGGNYDDDDEEVILDEKSLNEKDCCEYCSLGILPEVQWHYRWIVILQAFLSPFFISFATRIMFLKLFSGIYVIYVVLIVALVGSLVTFAMTRPKWHQKIYGHPPSADNEPYRHPIVACYGFIVGIFWIYLIANELVGLLKSLGRILSISGAILGITVFAFGNSIGDLVSNVTMARMGFPTMAMSASFAGPLINILLTLGLGGLLNGVIQPVHIRLSTNLFMTFIGLFLMLFLDLIAIPLKHYRVGRGYGLILLLIYVFVILLTITCDLMGWEIPGLDPNEDP